MALEIRILRAGEESVLTNIADGAFDNSLDPTCVTRFLASESHHLVVAVDGGQVIGLASGVNYLHLDKPSEMWISDVGVAPGHQGQGVGKAMIEKLLQHAASLGCREAWVLADRDNQAARRLYASTGGQETAHDRVMFTFNIGGSSNHVPTRC